MTKKISIIFFVLAALIGFSRNAVALTHPPPPTYAEAPGNAGAPLHAGAPLNSNSNYSAAIALLMEASDSGFYLVQNRVDGSSPGGGGYEKWFYAVLKTPQEKAQARALLTGSFLPDKPSDVASIFFSLLRAAGKAVKNTAQASGAWPSSFAGYISIKGLKALGPDIANNFKKELTKIGVDYAASAFIDMASAKLHQKGLVGDTGKELIDLWGNLAVDALRGDVTGAALDASFAVYDSWQTTNEAVDAFQQSYFNALSMQEQLNASRDISWSQEQLEIQMENSMFLDRTIQWQNNSLTMVRDGFKYTVDDVTQAAREIGTRAHNAVNNIAENFTKNIANNVSWYKAYLGG